MMIVMTPDAGEREIAAVRGRLETTGVHVLVMPGELTTAIGAIGDPEGVRTLGLEGMPGVDRVVPISRPYKLASVPWLKLHSHLPVIVDPSHASGDRRLVEPLARAAAAVGADGIIVEVHRDPAEALCDGPQALYGSDFEAFAARVAAHASLDGRRIA